MKARIAEQLVICGLFGIALACSLYVSRVTARDTPALSGMKTTAIEQRITNDRIARVQADTDEAMALCGYARSEAALADAKAGWLRARLEILYRRQGKMPTRLSQWPGGDVPAMEGIR